MTEHLELPVLCNCARIRRASRVMTRYYDSVLAPSGLGINQFTLLGYLHARGPMPLNRLSDLLAMDRATIGHNVRPLERDGLLRLVQSSQDRRVKMAELTAKGLAKLDEARPLWFDAQKNFENVVGAEQAETIRAAMDAISDHRTNALAPLGVSGGSGATLG
ncbi:MAG TPA: MarR family winged helix-turn-helix transcriptional regulator [Acetobacteraceae bacterium]|nr:MarR family winged helix-turn-helix transcriptional regulator [Acetobacteraceae bacterium]